MQTDLAAQCLDKQELEGLLFQGILQRCHMQEEAGRGGGSRREGGGADGSGAERGYSDSPKHPDVRDLDAAIIWTGLPGGLHIGSGERACIDEVHTSAEVQQSTGLEGLLHGLLAP